MMSLSYNVIAALQGCTLATAESCTGGQIGAALTAIPGSSQIYKGGIISYTNEIKVCHLNVPPELLEREGAVSASVAEAMAEGVRKSFNTDIAVSVTGLAGPAGDEFGNPVGTVFLGYADAKKTLSRKYHFDGDREFVRTEAVRAALYLLLEETCSYREKVDRIY